MLLNSKCHIGRHGAEVNMNYDLVYCSINGRTRKHIKSCLILIYLKICISGQFTPPFFKAL